VARAAARQISFADVELMRQGVRLEPLLEVISSFLDRQHELIERVRRDLVRGLKKPRKGRRGLTAPQVLRSLVLMCVKNWNYRELRERIADGLTLGPRTPRCSFHWRRRTNCGARIKKMYPGLTDEELDYFM
jgi:transposase, IS5 family